MKTTNMTQEEQIHNLESTVKTLEAQIAAFETNMPVMDYYGEYVELREKVDSATGKLNALVKFEVSKASLAYSILLGVINQLK